MVKYLRLILLISAIVTLTIGFVLDGIGDSIIEDGNSPFGYDVQFQIYKTSASVNDMDIKKYIIEESVSNNADLIYDVFDGNRSERIIYPIGSTNLNNEEIVYENKIKWFKKTIKGYVVPGGYLDQNPYIGVYRLRSDRGLLEKIESYLNDRSVRIQIAKLEENIWSWITVPTRILIVVSVLCITSILIAEKVIGITKNKMIYLISRNSFIAYMRVNARFYWVLMIGPPMVLVVAYYFVLEYDLYDVERFIKVIFLSYSRVIVVLLFIGSINDIIFYNNGYTSRSDDEYIKRIYHRVSIIQIFCAGLVAINISHIVYSQYRLHDLDANWKFWSRYPYVGFIDASLPLETYEFNQDENNSINEKGNALLESISSKSDVYLCTPIHGDVAREPLMYIVSESYLKLVAQIPGVYNDLEKSKNHRLDPDSSGFSLPSELKTIWKKQKSNLNEHAYVLNYSGHPFPLIYHGASGGMEYRNNIALIVIDNPIDVFRIDTFLSNEIRNANLFFSNVHQLSNDVKSIYPSYLSEFNTFRTLFRNLYEQEIQVFKVLSLSIYSAVVGLILIFYVSNSCYINLNYRKYVLLSISAGHSMASVSFVLADQFVQMLVTLILIVVVYLSSEQLQSVVDIVQINLIVVTLFILQIIVMIFLFNRFLDGNLKRG